MKIKSLGFIVIAAVVLSACGQEAENTKEPAAKSQKEEVDNKKNVKEVVKAVSDENVRYKLAIDDEMNVFAISENFRIFSGNDEDNSYGFDDPETGTSVYAFAFDKGLNEEQTAAIESLLSTSAVDENGKELKNVGEYYPEGFSDDLYPYEGTDLDYLTLSNVETEPSEKGEKITADVTVHLHLVDGTEESKTFKSFAEPDKGDTELDKERVEESLSADIMNKEIPTEDRFIYVDE